MHGLRRLSIRKRIFLRHLTKGFGLCNYEDMRTSIPTEDAFCGQLRAALRARRGEIGAKNADIARRLETSPQTVSGWFTGNGPPPRVGALYSLCLLMETTVEEIVKAACKTSS